MTDHPLDLDSLEALARKATPGPWRALGSEVDASLLAICDCENGDDPGVNEAAYIAAANPQTLLALIQRLREHEEHAPGCDVCSIYPDECGCWD